MSIINCALFGDLHLNVPKRTDEARRVAEWIRDDAQARGVHLFGIPGDVMDGPMTELDRVWLQKFLRSCADIAPVVIVAGNHDARYSLGQFRSRSVDQRETKYPIYVEEAADIFEVHTEAGDIAIACVAFPWKAEILARTGNIGVEDADQVAQDALRTVFLDMGMRVRELGLPTIALVHAAMRGSKISSDQPARPLGLEIPVEDLAQIGAHFGVVGHVHLAQEFSFNGVEFVTPSSPFYTDFGEAKHPKGYIWAKAHSPLKGLGILINGDDLTTLDMSKHSKRVTWERIPTPVTPMLLLEGAWHTEGDVGGFIHKNESDLLCRYPTPGGVPEFSVDVAGADVRFRFNYPKDVEKQAKDTAGNFEKALRFAGAVNVTLDPVPEPAIRSRIPELATAVTPEEKAALYRESTDAKVSEDEQKILDQYLREIQDELAQEGVSFGVQSRAVPTLKRIRGKGWHCYPGEFDIPLEKLGKLVAVVGPNESGKTLLASLMGPGLMYGNTPNRGTLDELSRARDAYIEGTFDMGGIEYTLAQMSNAMVKTNKGHVNLTSGGKPVLQKAGRREYDEWASKNLLPWNQYLTLLFHSGVEDDGGRKINIIDMKDGARTELMLKVLGIEYYELIAKRARDKSSGVTGQLSSTNARLDELNRYADISLEVWDEKIAGLIYSNENSVTEIATGEKTLSELRERNLGIEKERSDYANKTVQRKELETKIAGLEQSLADINTRIANNQDVVDQAENIRAAHIEVDSLQQQLDNLQERDRDLKIAGLRVENILDIATREHKAQEARRHETIREIASLNGIVATQASVQSTIDSIPEFEAAVREAITDRDGALKEYEELQATRLSGAEDRIGALRTGHQRIVQGEESETAVTIARTTLSADDQSAKDVTDHPQLLLQAKAAWQQRDQRATEVAGQLARLHREAEKMVDIVAARNRVADLEEAVRATEKEIEASAVNIEAHTAERDRIAKTIVANDESAKSVSAQVAQLKPLAGRLDVLNSAEARIQELSKQQAGIAADIELSKEMAHELSFLAKPPEPVELRGHENALASLREAAEGVRTRLMNAQQGRDATKERNERRTTLQAEAERLLKQLDRWNRTAREFGVDGLQKEEIANAGPRLTQIVNELLQAGGDTRHTVDIRTEKPHSREKRMIPCFDIMIRDSEERQDKESRRLSGAGQVIVGKPLAMAMVLLGCERAGIKSCTIFFDELTGPADSENSVKIIGAVRHFAKRLNAQVLYVSQDPDIQDMADNKLLINNGKVSVV